MRNYKKDFPIFKNNPDLVYLDSAATSQKPQIVIDAIKNYYETYNSNVRRGLYPIAEKATQKVEEVRRQVAKFINAKYPEEIIFVRNTTEAINLVAYSMSHNIRREDSIVATIMEHHSNFVPWQQLAVEKNANFDVIDINENCDLRFKIKDLRNTKILAITHVSNVLGTINPIKNIVEMLKPASPASTRGVQRGEQVQHDKEIVVLVDAAQAVGHMKVDVQELDCDFLAFSGHKMMAGTGIGVLYGKKKLLEQMSPFLFGGEMIREVDVEKTTFLSPPFKFEAGTPDIAGIISLGEAIEYINSTGIKNIQNHDNRLTEYCLDKMKKIDGLRIYGPSNHVSYTSIPDMDRAGIVSFTLEGVHPHDIAQVLGDMGICIRAGHHCAMPLHKKLGISATARVSFHIYNTEQDVDRFIEGIKEVKKIFNV